MRFAIFHALCALWVIWRFWLPLRVSQTIKLSGVIGTILIALFPAVTATFFGGLISPEVPAWVLIIGNGATFTLVLLSLLTLCREVIIFASVLAGRSGERTHQFVQKDKRVALGMTLASVTLSTLGVREGIKVPDVHEMILPIKDCPKAFEGFRIVQLSDLHASALLCEPHMAALVEKVNALHPDLIVITGDIVDGEVAARDKDVAPLAKLKAPYGVIAVEGNHEHYVDYEGWMKKLPTLGMTVLRNECITLQRDGATLTIGGVTDPWGRRFGRTLPDPVKAFEKAPENGPRILLSHQPKYANDFDDTVRFDVQLSGHTHGGQVYGLDKGVAILNHMFVRGWYQLNRAVMYVHSGSGLWNGFPVRFGVPAEIAVFTLSKKN